MAKLLTPQQIADIKSALHDVTDTFCDTPIVYKMFRNMSDRFGEATVNSDFMDYNLMALVEYRDNDSDFIVKTPAGAELQSDVKCTLNYQDLAAISLIDGNRSPVMVAETDRVIVNGKLYRVVYVGMDGPLDRENVLVIIHGELMQKES